MNRINLFIFFLLIYTRKIDCDRWDEEKEEEDEQKEMEKKITMQNKNQ